jgi:hypothetical protein
MAEAKRAQHLEDKSLRVRYKTCPSKAALANPNKAEFFFYAYLTVHRDTHT